MPHSISLADSRLLLLYGTAACQLCEDASTLLGVMPELQGWALDCIDIADDEALLLAYGSRIPVLADARTGAELHWPFAAADVRALIAHARALEARAGACDREQATPGAHSN